MSLKVYAERLEGGLARHEGGFIAKGGRRKAEHSQAFCSCLRSCSEDEMGALDFVASVSRDIRSSLTAVDDIGMARMHPAGKLDKDVHFSNLWLMETAVRRSVETGHDVRRFPRG